MSPSWKSQAFSLTFPDGALLLCVYSYDGVRQGGGGGHQNSGRSFLTSHQATRKVAILPGTTEPWLVGHAGP